MKFLFPNIEMLQLITFFCRFSKIFSSFRATPSLSQPISSAENPGTIEGYCTPMINRKMSGPLSSVERSDSGISSCLGVSGQVQACFIFLVELVEWSNVIVKFKRDCKIHVSIVWLIRIQGKVRSFKTF